MFREFRTQLLLWTILPLAAILIGVAYLGVSSHQAAMRDLVEERDGALARVTAARLSESINTHIAILQTIDPARPETWSAQQAQFDGGIASFGARGELIAATPSREVWETRRAALANDVVPRPIFSALLHEGGAPRVVVVTAPLTPQPPLPSPDAPQERGEGAKGEWGEVAGAFTLPSLTNIGTGARGAVYLVDANGKIIAHPNAARLGEDLARHAGIAQVMRGEAGATFHHDARGEELVVGYAPMAVTGWGLIVEEPWADVVAPMFQYSVLLPFLLLLAAIVALGALFFGVRNVIRPLQNLTHAANRIAFGDYRAAERAVGGVREIEDLRETLDGMARQVRDAQDAMQNYITTILRGQEDERMRLARELHDDTIQSLIVLQQRIEMAHKALAQDPARAAAKIEELKALLGDTLTSVRRFVRDLRPTYLEELGLIPALEMLTRETSATFAVEGAEARLDAERELALFRIVQEALRNVQKHARAQKIAVRLDFDGDDVTATIEDDGVGFAAPDAPTAYARAGHFGLMGMQERAQLFGGNVYVKSERGKGTKVVAYVPVK